MPVFASSLSRSCCSLSISSRIESSWRSSAERAHPATPANANVAEAMTTSRETLIGDEATAPWGDGPIFGPRPLLYRPPFLGQDWGLPKETPPDVPPPTRKLDLRKTLFLLPNIITLSSVFCGFDSIRISATAQADDDYYRASLLLVFALFFDMLDGRVARLTKTQSAFGLQIDSLADAISFGVAPAILVYKWSLWQRPMAGLVASFIFAAAGVVRLARFNVLSMGEKGAPTKPGVYIVGLPVPGAAGILISLILANHAMGDELRLYSPRYVWALFALTLFLSFLMVSTIKFRSFKDLRLNARTFALVA